MNGNNRGIALVKRPSKVTQWPNLRNHRWTTPNQQQTLQTARPWTSPTGTAPKCRESCDRSWLSPSSHTCPLGTLTKLLVLPSPPYNLSVAPSTINSSCSVATMRLQMSLPASCGLMQTVMSPLRNRRAILLTRMTSPCERIVGSIDSPVHCYLVVVKG